MQYSYSRVSLYKRCPYAFKLKYIDLLETIPNFDSTNALIMGTCLHEGIQISKEYALNHYYNYFPVINDQIENNALQLDIMIDKARPLLPTGQYELKVENERYRGFIDLLGDDGNIYDFKYSNNKQAYLSSPQIHLYKHYGHYDNAKLYYVIVPKSQIKQRKIEILYEFRERIKEDLKTKQIEIVEVPFDIEKVRVFEQTIEEIEKDTTYEKNCTELCYFCEYQKYCQEGLDYEIIGGSNMNLPSSQRREVGSINNRKIWIYGAPTSGKTTMLDEAPNPLNLNTDGNIKNVTMPFLAMKDEVNPRSVDAESSRKYAWEVFKETLTELEKGNNDFKTIIIDLVEDLRESCRLYEYKKLGISHESDAGFGKGYDMVKTEFLSVMKRFFNLPYENLIIVSHEDKSKDITRKNGDQVTRIAPNIPEALANKLAGMVDIIARVVVEDDNTRTLNFKSDNIIFGGSRFNVSVNKIPLKWSSLMKLYDDSLKNNNIDKASKQPYTAQVAAPTTAPVQPAQNQPKRKSLK